LRAAYQRFGESRNDRSFNKTVLRNRTEAVDAVSFNADFRKNISEKISLSYGSEYIFNEVNSSGTDRDIKSGTIGEGPSRYPDAVWMSWAGYGLLSYQPLKKIRLSSGLRWNGYSLQADFDTAFYPLPFTSSYLRGGSLTGSLGLVYQFTEKWHFNISAATAFRAPNVDDSGKIFDSEPGSVVVPNPDLKSEYAWNGEAGITGVIGEFLKIDINGYYTILENAMVRRDFTLNGLDSIFYNGELSQVQAIQNAAAAFVYGWHVSLEYAPAKGLRISGKMNIQTGEEELDDGSRSPLRHAAPAFGNIRVSYEYKKLRSEISCEFMDEVPYDKMPSEFLGTSYLFALDKSGNPYTPSWIILNVRSVYKINESFALSAGMDNILNIRYRPYGSGIAAAGRNVNLKLSVKF
jgi:hemoglobin/transferrin/lactoferrin receptor protein